MRIHTFEPPNLHEAVGIDMGDVPVPGATHLGLSWGRVEPGVRSAPHQHDETELFVIVAGSGEVVVDKAAHRVRQGTVIVFEPFETHTIENTGETDLVLTSFVWRETSHAARLATSTERRRFADRPLFVFSTPPTPNGDLHLGHLSGPYLGADAYVRYQRLIGNRAWHLTGSDDYQSYVTAVAAKEGSTPAEAAAHYSAEIAATLKAM